VRCLIIEDEKPLAIATAEALKEHGWVVDLAHDGRTVLSMGMQSDYDVICIDIMLPALNGYDVLKHLRAGEVCTPVLMLTAKDGEYDQTDAFELGADDYVTKPFRLAELLARARALLRRGPGEATASEDAPVRIDPAGHRVFVQGEEIGLTAKEFELLSVLARHEGRVVSREQLMR